eukprot:XP_766699.1 hypothetical protein [Theileria parva strain Muguga]
MRNNNFYINTTSIYLFNNLFTRIGKIILLILYNISFVVCEVECDDDHKCQEGSKCVKITLGQNSYNLCVCAPGFTGWDCSTPIDYCNKHCRPLQTGVSCKHTLCNQEELKKGITGSAPILGPSTDKL